MLPDWRHSSQPRALGVTWAMLDVCVQDELMTFLAEGGGRRPVAGISSAEYGIGAAASQPPDGGDAVRTRP
ncbi:hypothetical protein GCM10007242_35300 [Pigmentiphaga litoralis]|nr:hypothetical protein GCM10007242_35300 [Pigmentiphaga litoralis]